MTLSWRAEGWVGVQFGLQARYVPPPQGVLPPSAWGTVERLRELFADRLSALRTTAQTADFVHHSTVSLFELFKDWFGPVATVLAGLDSGRGAAFTQGWIALADEHNVATDGTCEIPSGYLQVVAVKA